jgi:SAM-dependent methyltransferase
VSYWDDRYVKTLLNGSTGMMRADGNDNADLGIFECIKYMTDGKDYDSILDYGCGLGNKVEFLESLGALRIYGYDISDVAINQASIRYPSHRFANTLEFFPDVDMAYCHFVLQHIMDDSDLVKVLSDLRLRACEMIVIDNISDKPDLGYIRFRSDDRHEDLFRVTGWEDVANAVTKIGDETVKIWLLR